MDCIKEFSETGQYGNQPTNSADEELNLIQEMLNEILNGEPSPSTTQNTSNKQDETTEIAHELERYKIQGHSEGSNDIASIIRSSSTSSSHYPDTEGEIIACIIVLLEAMVEDIFRRTGEKYRLEFTDLRIIRVCNSVDIVVSEMTNLNIEDNYSDALTTNKALEAPNLTIERREVATLDPHAGKTSTSLEPKTSPTVAIKNLAADTRLYQTALPNPPLPNPFTQAVINSTTDITKPLHPQSDNPTSKYILPSSSNQSWPSSGYVGSSKSLPQYAASNSSYIYNASHLGSVTNINNPLYPQFAKPTSNYISQSSTQSIVPHYSPSTYVASSQILAQNAASNSSYKNHATYHGYVVSYPPRPQLAATESCLKYNNYYCDCVACALRNDRLSRTHAQSERFGF